MKYFFLLITLMVTLLLGNADEVKKKYLFKKHLEQKNQSLMWKKLKHRLWKDKFGNIGFKTSGTLREEVFVDIYITTMGEDKQLKDIVDIDTFEQVGSLSYFKDKNHDDLSYYAKDKYGYYYWGEKITDTNSSEFLEIKKILDKQSNAKKKRLL